VASALAAPDATPLDSAKLAALSKANDDFGLVLLHRLELAEKQERGQKQLEPRNIFISPFSISTVISMLMAGGGNETYAEIHKTLGFDGTVPESELYSTYQGLFGELQRLIQESDKQNELQLANSIALQDKMKILPTYESLIQNQFGARLFPVNFATESHQATEKINSWASDATNGKIAKLFDKDLDPLTVMVLLNAVYFKGTWKYQFEADQTAKSTFTYNVNQQEQVDTMKLKGTLKHAHFDDGELVELPYQGDRLSMLAYLPDIRWVKEYQTLAGQFSRVVEHGSTKLASRIASLQNVSVELLLPKFQINSDFHLKPELQNLGIRKAFTESAADFSRINGGRDLFLYDVIHKAHIEVNEKGSEAAAVTAGEVHTKSLPMIHLLDFNRPFLFLIRDNVHQVTLFAGVVNKP